jgi:DNA polymerase III delta prime subunit
MSSPEIAPPPRRRRKRLYKLVDVDVRSIALVPSAANRRRFCLFKSADELTDSEVLALANAARPPRELTPAERQACLLAFELNHREEREQCKATLRAWGARFDDRA